MPPYVRCMDSNGIWKTWLNISTHKDLMLATRLRTETQICGTQYGKGAQSVFSIQPLSCSLNNQQTLSPTKGKWF